MAVTTTVTFPLPPSFPPTTTIFHPSQTTPPTTLLLFIPGNPGLITYYTDFLAHLSTHLPSTTILGASHAGFTSPSRIYTVSEQTHLKLRLLQHFIATCSPANGARVVVVAHSMGCYITQELVRLAPGLISGVIMLFPAVLHLRQTPQGRIIASGLKWTRTIRGAAWIASWVPGVLAWVSGHGVEHVEASLKPWVVAQTVGLADDEMRVIGEDRWGEEVWGMPGRWYFGAKDRWVGESIGERLKEKLGSRAVLDAVGTPHAFSLRHGEVMAVVVDGLVKDVLEEVDAKMGG